MLDKLQHYLCIKLFIKISRITYIIRIRIKIRFLVQGVIG